MNDQCTHLDRMQVVPPALTVAKIALKSATIGFTFVYAWNAATSAAVIAPRINTPPNIFALPAILLSNPLNLAKTGAGVMWMRLTSTRLPTRFLEPNCRNYPAGTTGNRSA